MILSLNSLPDHISQKGGKKIITIKRIKKKTLCPAGWVNMDEVGLSHHMTDTPHTKTRNMPFIGQVNIFLNVTF